MGLNFQQKLVLKDGSLLLYHEGILQSGDTFHVLIAVPGKNIETYFSHIASKENFAVSELEAYGSILRCDTGSLTNADIESITRAYNT